MSRERLMGASKHLGDDLFAAYPGRTEHIINHIHKGKAYNIDLRDPQSL